MARKSKVKSDEVIVVGQSVPNRSSQQSGAIAFSLVSISALSAIVAIASTLEVHRTVDTVLVIGSMLTLAIGAFFIWFAFVSSPSRIKVVDEETLNYLDDHHLDSIVEIEPALTEDDLRVRRSEEFANRVLNASVPETLDAINDTPTEVLFDVLSSHLPTEILPTKHQQGHVN